MAGEESIAVFMMLLLLLLCSCIAHNVFVVTQPLKAALWVPVRGSVYYFVAMVLLIVALGWAADGDNGDGDPVVLFDAARARES